MAQLTGILEADFSKFYDAVTKANSHLTEFEGSANKVQTSLQRMADQFSGEKLISDASLMAEAVTRLGGVSKMTAAEIAKIASTTGDAVEKMRALGMDIPDKLQAVADASKQANSGFLTLSGTMGQVAGALGIWTSAGAVVSGITDFTKGLFEAADASQKLADKTGMSVTEIFKLQAVATETNTSVDTMTAAIAHLQANLTDKGTIDALHQLGINLADIRTASPYDALHMVADALGQIEDPAERARLRVETLGKQSADMASSMGADWDGITKKVGESVDEQVKAMNRLSQSFKTGWGDFEREGMLAIANVALAFEKFKESPLAFGKNLAAAIAAGADPYDAVQAIGKVEGAVRHADEVAKKSQLVPTMGPVLTNLADLQAQAGGTFQSLQTGAEGAIAKSRELNQAWEKQKTAWAELATVGVDYRDTIDKMNGSTAAAIDYYLRAGASQSTLATAYGVTAAQVAAVAEALKVEQKALDETEKSIDRTRELWREYGTFTEEQTATSTEKQIIAIDRWYNAEVAKLKDSDLNWENHYMVLGLLRDEHLKNIQVNFDEINKVSKKSLEDQAARAQATFEYMLANTDQFTSETIQKQREQADALAQQVAGWNTVGDAAVQSQQKAKAATDQTNESIKQQTSSMQTLQGTFSVLIQSADKWRETAARYEADAARMEQNVGAGSGSWYGQTIRNYRDAAKNARASAAYEEDIQAKVAGANAPWGNAYSINVNAMQGIDGDQIAGELVNGMRRRGISLG